jgi:ABC transporter
VSFRYPNRPDRVVLDHLSFSVPEGTTIALVGASGGGKSTILGLVERFYDTTSGELLIEGMEIKDYNLLELRKLVGCVAQEPTLFGGTIMQNILYGRLDATEEEVVSAAQVSEWFLSSGHLCITFCFRRCLVSAPILSLSRTLSLSNSLSLYTHSFLYLSIFLCNPPFLLGCQCTSIH